MGYKSSLSSGQGLQGHQKKRKSFLMRVIVILVLLLVIVPLLYEVARNNSEIQASRESLAAMLEEERIVAIENEQFRRYSEGENFDEYLERFARNEMGYADPQERVFHVRPGATDD